MSRSSIGVLGDYRPGNTPIHRLSAGAKLLAMMVAAVIVVMAHGPGSAVGAVAVAIGLLAWAGARPQAVLGSLRRILVVVVLLGAWQAWQSDVPHAIEAVGDLVALVLLATVLTVTTAIDEILDTITRALGPMRRFGVRPDTVALAFSLTLRAIPTTIAIADETRDAALARGLEHDPRARLTPLVIRVVAHARATGDALQARGIGDD